MGLLTTVPRYLVLQLFFPSDSRKSMVILHGQVKHHGTLSKQVCYQAFFQGFPQGTFLACVQVNYRGLKWLPPKSTVGEAGVLFEMKRASLSHCT